MNHNAMSVFFAIGYTIVLAADSRVSLPMPSQEDELPYKSLRVSDQTIHPLQEQLDTHITIVPWTSPKNPEILLSGYKRFASRNVIFKVCDKAAGMPVYDAGTTLLLKGVGFQTLLRESGLFDLMAYGADTVYGVGQLIYYRNTGTPDLPAFEEPYRVEIGGKPLNAQEMSFSGWCLEDINQDGVYDLFITGYTRKSRNEYWPDNESMWDGKPQPNAGPGRGYSINGQWLGGTVTTTLYWAKGQRDEAGKLSFGSLTKVYDRHEGFAVQWKAYSANRALGFIHLSGRRYLLHTGSTDQILAMPISFKGEELFCQAARNVLENGKSVLNCYYPSEVTIYDLDSDGVDEILLAGNNGRIAVLKGTEMGKFKELPPLMMKGGRVCVDTLATPCRVKWDDDAYEDLIIGDSSGNLTFWPGTADPTIYGGPMYLQSDGRIIHHQAGLTGSIQGPTEDRWGYLNPEVGDWDNDGRLEIITGDINSDITLYQKTDNPFTLSKPERFTLDGQPLPAAWRVKPAILSAGVNFQGTQRACLLYLDWDGDAAVAIPSDNGGTRIQSSIKLTYSSGEPIRLCGQDGLWGRTKLAVADWDYDGDWDILFGAKENVIIQFFKDAPKTTSPYFIENIGTSGQPVFEKPVMIKTSDGNTIDFPTHNASVYPTDLDQDGTLDLIVGAEDGKVYYFYRHQLSMAE